MESFSLRLAICIKRFKFHRRFSVKEKSLRRVFLKNVLNVKIMQ